MKKCIKCGNFVNSPVPYCPNCGTLLPKEKEKELVYSSEYQRYKKVSEDLVLYSKKEYEDAVNFYNNHLSTGYAPNGKMIIEQAEYERLKKAEEEYEQNKKRYGTQLSFVTVDGSLSFLPIPKYGVTQRTVNRSIEISFGDYWKKLYDDQNLLVRIWIQAIFWLLIASCAIMTLALFAKQTTLCTTLGVIIELFGMVISFWVAGSIFDYD